MRKKQGKELDYLGEVTMTEMTLEEYLQSQAQTHKKRHITHPEFDDQCAVFKWAQMQENIYPELKYLFSTMNGVRLPIGLAVKAKKAGMKRGPLDIWFPVRRGCYCGLVIELKHGANKPDKEQLEWIAFLNSQGYYARAKWGHDETIKTIISYLEGRLCNEISVYL